MYKALEEEKNPVTLVDELGISQMGGEDEIRAIAIEVIDENSHLISDYKAGKRVFDFFVGQVMKKTKGRANPAMTAKILKEELDKR